MPAPASSPNFSPCPKDRGLPYEVASPCAQPVEEEHAPLFEDGGAQRPRLDAQEGGKACAQTCRRVSLSPATILLGRESKRLSRTQDRRTPDWNPAKSTVRGAAAVSSRRAGGERLSATSEARTSPSIPLQAHSRAHNARSALLLAKPGIRCIACQILNLDNPHSSTVFAVGDHQVRPIRCEIHPVGHKQALKPLFRRFKGRRSKQSDDALPEDVIPPARDDRQSPTSYRARQGSSARLSPPPELPRYRAPRPARSAATVPAGRSVCCAEPASAPPFFARLDPNQCVIGGNCQLIDHPPRTRCIARRSWPWPSMHGHALQHLAQGIKPLHRCYIRHRLFNKAGIVRFCGLKSEKPRRKSSRRCTTHATTWLGPVLKLRTGSS